MLTWIGWNWLLVRWVPNNSNQFVQSSIFQSSKNNGINNNNNKKNKWIKSRLQFSHDLQMKWLRPIRMPDCRWLKKSSKSTSYKSYFIGRKLISVSKFFPSFRFEMVQVVVNLDNSSRVNLLLLIFFFLFQKLPVWVFEC